MGNDSLLMAKASEAKGVDPASPISPIQPARDGSERDLNALRRTVQRASCNGCGPSGEGIAKELIGMPPAERGSVMRGLQQTRGNRYAGRLAVQAKLKIGAPGDKYEQEADRVAEAVMRRQGPEVQRQPVKEEEEEEKIQTKPIPDQITPLIQRQIEPEEEEEEEKIRKKPIADQITPLIQRQIEPEEEEEEEKIQTKPVPDQITPLIQRQIEPKEEEEEDIQTKPIADQITPLIQREIEPEEEEEILRPSSAEAVSFTKTASNTAEVIRTRGSGAPMHSTTRRTLESYMGVDLSEVRVHNDSSAHQASASLKARAFAHKNHIWLGAGESQTDLRLMSHETTHVLQQGGIVRRKTLETEEGKELVQTLPNSVAEQATASAEPGSSSRTPSPRSPGGGSAVSGETRGAGGATAATPIASHEEVPQTRAESARSGATAPGPPPSAPAGAAPADVAPEDRERLQTVMESLGEAATDQEGPAASPDSQRQASQQAAEDASAAAPSPTNEAQAMGEAGQVETMNAQEAGVVDQGSFLEIVRRRLREIVPSTPNDLDEFRERGGASGLREGLLQTANQQAEKAQAAIRSATEGEAAPGEARVPEALPEQAGPGRAPDLRASEALPQPREEAEVSLEESRQVVESRLSEENLTEDRLRQANDPRFSVVQEAREAVHEHADAAPQEFREEEQALLSEEEGAIAREETTALREMEESRERSQGEIEAEQQTSMTVEERRRREVSDHIEAVYNRTRQAVEERLNGLNREVESRFSEGERRARERFEEYIDSEMTAWKLRRYGTRAIIPFVGAALAAGTWLYDYLRNINEYPEIKQIYEDGKNQYIADLDAVIVEIADLVDTTLAWCQDQIQSGHEEIQEYVEGLPESLREVGEETSSRISERYDELRASVEERRNALADQLVERYQQARQALDQRIEEMRAENRGLVNRFVEGLEAVLEAIRNFRDRLMSIIGEAGDVIEQILEDPIGFLSNLVDAVKMGFRQFGANILEHLRRGLMGWLFGTLASVGITIPSEFSVRAVVGLILQILGITYDRIRAKVARIIGERNVAMLEQVWGYVSTLIREGPIGLWEQIREELGDLKDMVIEGIKQWVVTRIIVSAITRLVSMFNPAGAIIQAVMAIYNTVMFFIERMGQIMELAQSIVRSLGAIVRGQLSAAASRVEQVMGLTLPVIISFLARLLGLGGIAGTISNIIGRARRRVDRAIDSGLRKVVRRIKGLFSRGRGQREESPETEVIGDYIYETQAGGHIIKIRKDLKVFRFSEPAPVTGDPAQAVKQKALKDIVPDADKPINYRIITHNRAGGSSGYVRGIKDKERRSSLSVSNLPGYLPGDHRGHLIGDRFYGSNEINNLVPMHPTLNLSTFKTYEDMLARKYKQHYNAKEAVLLYMNVVPTYPKDDPTDQASFRPVTVTANSKIVTLKSGEANPTKKEEDVDSGPLTNPDVEISDFNINMADKSTLERVGLKDQLIRAILRERQPGRFKGRFKDFDDLMIRLVHVLGEPRLNLLEKLSSVRSKIKF